LIRIVFDGKDIFCQLDESFEVADGHLANLQLTVHFHFGQETI